MKAKTEGTRKWLSLLCACVVWTTGCFTRRAPARPVINGIVLEHPVIPAAAKDTILEAPPDLALEGPEAPEQLATSHIPPPRPRVAPSPAPEPAAEEGPAGPIIVPEVTTEEMTEAKSETQHSLEVAEKNLTLAWGRKLNATQEDLISKVRGFTENAREAMRSGDWVRAKNLSKKAEVLSEQLAASL